MDGSVRWKLQMSVAIELGLRTCYAVSLSHEQDKIKLNKSWGKDLGIYSYTTPTCVLTNPEGYFDTFGYDAEYKYCKMLAESNNGYNLYKNLMQEILPNEVRLV